MEYIIRKNQPNLKLILTCYNNICSFRVHSKLIGCCTVHNCIYVCWEFQLRGEVLLDGHCCLFFSIDFPTVNAIKKKTKSKMKMKQHVTKYIGLIYKWPSLMELIIASLLIKKKVSSLHLRNIANADYNTLWSVNDSKPYRILGMGSP